MQVMTTRSGASRAWLPKMSDAVDALGTVDFFPALLTSLNTFSGFPFLFAGRVGAAGPEYAPCIGHGRDTFEGPKTLALRQIDDTDPMAIPLQRALEGGAEGTVFVGQVDRDELTQPLRRELIFDRHHLKSRIGISALDETRNRYFMCLYRSASDRPLSASEQRWLVRTSPFLIALMRRHWHFVGVQRSDSHQALERLQDRDCLTDREREVCSAVLQGRTLQQVASRLGIAASTARTYQLRAFARLGVSTRQQLFQLLFPD